MKPLSPFFSNEPKFIFLFYLFSFILFSFSSSFFFFLLLLLLLLPLFRFLCRSLELHPPTSREVNSKAMYLHSSRLTFPLLSYIDFCFFSPIDHGSQNIFGLGWLEELPVTRALLTRPFRSASARFTSGFRSYTFNSPRGIRNLILFCPSPKRMRTKKKKEKKSQNEGTEVNESEQSGGMEKMNWDSSEIYMLFGKSCRSEMRIKIMEAACLKERGPGPSIMSVSVLL